MYQEEGYLREIALEYAKVTKHITRYYDNIDTATTSKKVIEEFLSSQRFYPTNGKQIYMLFDHSKFLPIYISDSACVTGFSPEDYYKMTLWRLFSMVPWKSLPQIYVIHVRGKEFFDLTKRSSAKNYEVFICGLKLKDKWGKTRVYLIKQKFISTDKNGMALLSVNIGEDITAMHKGNAAWMKMTDPSKEVPIQRVYFHQSNIRNEVLSKRELDILKLVIQGMNSAAIGQQLSISTETVKKHRKNMIAKVGAKDMTALIYICQQTNVI